MVLVNGRVWILRTFATMNFKGLCPLRFLIFLPSVSCTFLITSSRAPSLRIMETLQFYGTFFSAGMPLQGPFRPFSLVSSWNSLNCCLKITNSLAPCRTQFATSEFLGRAFWRIFGPIVPKTPILESNATHQNAVQHVSHLSFGQTQSKQTKLPFTRSIRGLSTTNPLCVTSGTLVPRFINHNREQVTWDSFINHKII